MTSRVLRVVLDIGHWQQAERKACTVVVTVREEGSTEPAWIGNGVTITAPTDARVWTAGQGEKLALSRALVDAHAPLEVVSAVWKVWRVEGRITYATGERKLGEDYRRISRRVYLSGKDAAREETIIYINQGILDDLKSLRANARFTLLDKG